LDSFPDDLSYCLHLLVGFDVVEVDHGGRLTDRGGVGPLVVVEGDPALCLSLAAIRLHGRAQTLAGGFPFNSQHVGIKT
jgi:hypothetical protein